MAGSGSGAGHGGWSPKSALCRSKVGGNVSGRLDGFSPMGSKAGGRLKRKREGVWRSQVRKGLKRKR